MGDLRNAKLRLEKLHSLCIVESEEEREKRLAREKAESDRLANMSPLERFVFTTTKDVNELQKMQIEYNDKMASDTSYDTSRGAVMMRNQMNKMKMQLRQKADRLPPARTEEEKKQRETLKKVLDKVKKSDRSQSGLGGGGGARGGSNLYSGMDGSAADPLLDGGGERPSYVQEWDGDGVPGGHYEPITMDNEFQQLMQGFREQDQEIEKALEMTAHGVTRLYQQSKEISTELKTQEVLLNEADKKMDDVTSKLQGVNKKLKKAVKDLNKDKMCMYVICFILLLGLIGFILVLTKTV